MRFNHKVDLELLKKNVNYHIDRLGENQRRDKKHTTRITLYNAFSAAAITAIIGLSKYIPLLEDPLQIFAIIIGATQAVINAYGSLFGHKQLWVIAAQSRRGFLGLREDIMHAENTDTITDELKEEFYLEYKAILGAEHSSWDDLRSITHAQNGK